MSLDWIQVDVLDMDVVVIWIPHPMIGESSLPNFEIRSKLFLCPKRKSAFDELDGAFERNQGRNQQMEVIWHQDEFVEKIGLASIGEEGFEKEASPRFGAE